MFCFRGKFDNFVGSRKKSGAASTSTRINNGILNNRNNIQNCAFGTYCSERNRLLRVVIMKNVNCKCLLMF